MNLAKLAKIQDFDQRKKIMMLLHKFEREDDKNRIVDRYIKEVEKWRKT
ncbi:hypothetical protein [Paenibacillus qinlingensis]|uniref:Uncharacterized protein n=1 Tax=Paenibacillus qinlingensis TaxID=1837343 RepID=A0ABU1P806_9BACL|nr:hypothetical protein [Paenibacillus qinlingensis]MDR6555456.1 hypothetical protein [Paenibacillus qinlingensis]